jgi:hypothetical protein
LTRQETDALWESGTVSFYGKRLPARRLRRAGRTVAMLHRGTWKVAGEKPRKTFLAAPAAAPRTVARESR